MNLFLDYQKKIFVFLKNLNKKKILRIPENFKNITIELPPQNQKGDISCNAAMLLAKFNNIHPRECAQTLKIHLLKCNIIICLKVLNQDKISKRNIY